MAISHNIYTAIITSILLICFSPTRVHADVAEEALGDILNAASGFGLCLTSRNVVLADVHPSPGDEIITLRKRLTLRADDDQDGNRVLSHVVSVIVKSSSTKQTLYESAPLAVNSRDFVQNLSDIGYSFSTIFNPSIYARFATLFPFGIECSGITVATYNGEPYIVLQAGTSLAEGTPDNGTDHTRIRLRVIRGADGSTARTTSVYAQTGNFILSSLPTISDIDDDGSQELLVWRMNEATRDDQLVVVVHVYDLLTNVREQFIAVPLNDRLIIE